MDDFPLFVRVCCFTAVMVCLLLGSHWAVCEVLESLSRWNAFLLQVGRDVADIRVKMGAVERRSRRPAFIAPPPLPHLDKTPGATGWDDEDAKTGLPDGGPVV